MLLSWQMSPFQPSTMFRLAVALLYLCCCCLTLVHSMQQCHTKDQSKHSEPPPHSPFFSFSSSLALPSEPHATASCSSPLPHMPLRSPAARAPPQRPCRTLLVFTAIQSLLPEFMPYFDSFKEPILLWLRKELQEKQVHHAHLHPETVIESVANTLIVCELPLMYHQRQLAMADSEPLLSPKAAHTARKKSSVKGPEREASDSLEPPLAFLATLLLSHLARMRPDQYLEPVRPYHTDLLIASKQLVQLLVLVNAAPCVLLSQVAGFLVYCRKDPKVSRVMISDTLLKPVFSLLQQFYEKHYGAETASVMIRQGLNPIPLTAIVKQWMHLYRAKSEKTTVNTLSLLASSEHSHRPSDARDGDSSHSTEEEEDATSIFSSDDLVSQKSFHAALHQLLANSLAKLPESMLFLPQKTGLRPRAKTAHAFTVARSKHEAASSKVLASAHGHSSGALLMRRTSTSRKQTKGKSKHRSHSCPEQLSPHVDALAQPNASGSMKKATTVTFVTLKSLRLFIRFRQQAYCAVLYAWLVKSFQARHDDALSTFLTTAPFDEKVQQALMNVITSDAFNLYQEDDLLQAVEDILSYDLDMFIGQEKRAGRHPTHRTPSMFFASLMVQLAADRIMAALAPRSPAFAAASLELCRKKRLETEDDGTLAPSRFSLSLGSPVDVDIGVDAEADQMFFKSDVFYALCSAYLRYMTPEKTAYYALKTIVYEEEGELRALFERYFTFLKLFPSFAEPTLPWSFFSLTFLFRSWISTIKSTPLPTLETASIEVSLFAHDTFLYLKQSVNARLKSMLARIARALSRVGKQMGHDALVLFQQLSRLGSSAKACLALWRDASSFPTCPQSPLWQCLQPLAVLL